MRIDRRWITVAFPFALLGMLGVETLVHFYLGKRTGLVSLLVLTWYWVVEMQAFTKKPRVPDIESIVGQAEWNAWIVFATTVAASMLILVQIAIGDDAMVVDPQLKMPISLFMPLVVRGGLSTILRAKFEGAIDTDERDREIASRVKVLGRRVLIHMLLIGIIVFGNVPRAFFPDLTPHFLATLLVLVMLAVWLIESIVTLRFYIADRREAQS